MGSGGLVLPLVVAAAFIGFASFFLYITPDMQGAVTGKVIGLAAASANCWAYTASSTCTAQSGCMWKNDSWGGWCQEKNCWSFFSQSECTGTPIVGKNCSWTPGGTTYSCDQLSCWSYSGTNQSACEGNSAGLNCQWSSQCYQSPNSPGSSNCWNYQSKSACLNATGCSWGNCQEKGCWSYNTQQTCRTGKDWSGRNCTWDSSYNYCTENSCWKLGSNSTATTSEKGVQCQNASSGLNCEWKWDSCQEKDCWSWDFTNASACEDNSLNLSCQWSGSSCVKKGCWNYNTQLSCQNRSKCAWTAHTSSGWCNEVNCYVWDSWNGGNQTACEGYDSNYGLNCQWSAWTGNGSMGSCYPAAVKTCANMSTEKQCMDTNYCWWQYTNPSTPSLGGNCKEPGSAGNFSVGTNTSIFNEWNPGCYIFDKNATICNATLGCNHTGTNCSIVPTHGFAGVINTTGLNCSMINDTSLCNSVSVLSTCCAWRGTACQADRFTTSCWDQMAQKTEKSCEDAKTETRCNQIADSPWFMPCNWDNSTEKCLFKSASVFSGNQSQSLVYIDNKKSCEAAGGKWITENYCEGNVSVPTGKCEYKFDEEDNCDKACFACEIRDSNGVSVNATNAKSACEGSKLGICEFVANANASNGAGFCKAKDQFKKGVASDCNTNCGDCTFKGDMRSNDTTKRPDYICNTRKADAAGEKCKWDNSTQTCIKKSDMTCLDSCDRCASQADCQDKGRTSVANRSGSCKWQGDSTSGNCVSNTGQSVEICWNGDDDNSNGLVDCADPGCYSDPFCGFVSGGCSGWNTNSSACTANGCEWVTDNWGSWCDVKGSQCWKYNVNSTICNAKSSCQWTNGSGNGWCEQDFSKSDICTGQNRTLCQAKADCNWTVDTWCQGQGNSTDWCKTSGGGWCEYGQFKSKNCWLYNINPSTCQAVSGCQWRQDNFSSSMCEMNMSANCWQFNTSPSCSNSGCYWRTEQWGSYCTNLGDRCWSSMNKTSCESQTSGSDRLCYWNTFNSGAGQCNPQCSNPNVTSASCSTTPGCLWKQSGWCEEQGMAVCPTKTSANQCRDTTGCIWRSSGWCDPKGGGFSTAAVAGSGGGGSTSSGGGECFRYDGNETACKDSSKRYADNLNISCSWMPEGMPRCDVNWAKNCWEYPNSTACFASGCFWKSDAFGQSCMNPVDQCWSLSTSITCGTNSNCTWVDNSCKPSCMNQTTSSGCTSGSRAGKCKWITGWCNSAGMGEIFNGMQAGAPTPLGMDSCNEAGMQASVDICGFGMKDMGESYGFGMMANDFSNSSVCNKEMLSSTVMGMAGGTGLGGPGGPGMGQGGGGFGTTFGNSKIGTGTDTIIYMVYLDTDGRTSGGCSLSHNSSAVGYEFRLKYSSVWNSSTSKAVETFNAYKCDNNDWKAADIKISVDKKRMCSEIGGPMIGIKKSDLSKFPLLYNSTADMRVYVATINSTGNVTNPTDVAGPGWTTPGSVDFQINDVFGYGANTAMFEDVLKNGFVKGEDCFNGIDDDNDGNADCNDWKCQYSPKCAGVGVNAGNVTDTRAPQVTSVKIEEYVDAATIMYDTNKPTNGTLELYGADSRCTNRTDVIYDVGILKSSTVRPYKLWHTAEIYNDGNPADNVSVNYPLANGTAYYYKLKICDSNGKCAISKCSNFTTASTQAKCAYCNFVTKLKAPSDWNVYYDLDQDGTYEHWQGNVCGPNAGMKTNYTDGRKANIKLASSDGTTYFEFVNVTLSKTGLNDKIRTISSSGSIIKDTTRGIVGLPSDTRDKIINNLHPEVCRIKIPNSGTCTKLYHCDDSGANCVDRTAEAGGAPIDATNCVWLAPYCEFSTYTTSLSAASSSPGGSSPGGGSGGGGGGSSANTFVLTGEQLASGYTGELAAKDRFRFAIGTETHYVTAHSIGTDSAAINVSSATQQATLAMGGSRSFELTGDGYYDISVKLESINTTSSKAKFTVKSVHELIPGGAANVPGSEGSMTDEGIWNPSGSQQQGSHPNGTGNQTWVASGPPSLLMLGIVVLLSVLAIALALLYKRMRIKS